MVFLEGWHLWVYLQGVLLPSCLLFPPPQAMCDTHTPQALRRPPGAFGEAETITSGLGPKTGSDVQKGKPHAENLRGHQEVLG